MPEMPEAEATAEAEAEAEERAEAETPMVGLEETAAPSVEEVEEAMLPLPLDRGYAWVVMLASMCNNFIIDGIANTYCEMLVDFIDYFADAPKSSLSLIGSLLCGVYLMSGPVAGGLVNKFGCRVTCIIGSLIASAAFFGSSFARSVTTLTLLYGVVGGIGLGLMYLPSIVIVNFYFRKRRSLAVGLAVCGTGIGTMVMGPVIRLLLSHYGWQNSLMILSAFVLNGVVFGGLMRPIDVVEESAGATTGPKTGAGAAPASEAAVAESQTPGSVEGGEKGGVDPLVKKYIRNIAQAAASPVDATEAEATVPTEEEDMRARSNSDSKAIHYKRSHVKHTKARGGRGSGGGGDNFMESTPDMARNHDIRVRQRGHTSAGADGGGGGAGTGSGGARRISRSRLQEVRRPLNQMDIFLSSSILDIAKHDTRIKRSLKDVSQADLYLSMTRLPQAALGSADAVGSAGVAASEESEAAHGWRRSRPFKYALALMTNFGLLRELSYLIVFVANMVGMIAFYIPGFFISDYAKEAGVPAALTPTLISAYGASNTLARIAFGFLAGHRRFSPLAINNATIVLTGLFVALLVLCRGYASMVTVFSLYGFFSAPYISLTSVILCQLIGLENVTNGFGLLVLARGLSSCCGPPIGGCLYSDGSGYLVPFLVSGALFSLSGFMHCLLHLPRFRRKEAANAEDIVRSLQSLASSRVQP